MLALALALGCASEGARPSTVAERRPTPSSVTRDDPAGDARSPVDAALTRLLEEPVGHHRDKFRTLVVPLADRPNWKRVRFIGYPTRVGFRYGDDHYAVLMLAYLEADGDDAPEPCLERFAQHARGVAKRFDLEVGDIEREESLLRRGSERPKVASGGLMPVLLATGWFTTLTNSDRYLAAIASHSSWPGTCLLQGFAVRIGTDEPLARKLVARFAHELAPQLHWNPGLAEAPAIANR
jgi:hypothetical protein